MKQIRKLFLILFVLGCLSIVSACDDNGCPNGTQEVRDLDGNLIDCAVP